MISTTPIVAQAQDTEDTTTVPVADDLGNSLPGPDAGPKPEDAGDRGGWLQFALFGAVMAAMAFFVVKLFRGPGGARPTQPDEPAPGAPTT